MKVLLIDADSTIPNIALMKLSTYYKNKADTVELLKLNIPYYPNRKKSIINVNTDGYDHIHCSVIFPNSLKYIKGNNILFGGTGFSLKSKLPDKIENLQPDYTIYPDNNISYGFISRGCIRNCYFCVVQQKEGYIRQVNTIDNIVKHKKVIFLDNNFLALNNHEDLLKELIDKNIKCQFNQGLDIRLINNSNSILLSKLNYIGEYIFAFDDIKYKKIIEEKLQILKWRKEYQFKFYVYVNPNDSIDKTIKRIEFLKENKILPYIMRDISCWNSEYKNFYTDIASYCNQPSLFKKMDFNTFLVKRYKKNLIRVKKSNELYNMNK